LIGSIVGRGVAAQCAVADGLAGIVFGLHGAVLGAPLAIGTAEEGRTPRAAVIDHADMEFPG